MRTISADQVDSAGGDVVDGVAESFFKIPAEADFLIANSTVPGIATQVINFICCFGCVAVSLTDTYAYFPIGVLCSSRKQTLGVSTKQINFS